MIYIERVHFVHRILEPSISLFVSSVSLFKWFSLTTRTTNKELSSESQMYIYFEKILSAFLELIFDLPRYSPSRQTLTNLPFIKGRSLFFQPTGLKVTIKDFTCSVPVDVFRARTLFKTHSNRDKCLYSNSFCGCTSLLQPRLSLLNKFLICYHINLSSVIKPFSCYFTDSPARFLSKISSFFLVKICLAFRFWRCTLCSCLRLLISVKSFSSPDSIFVRLLNCYL